ncbi:response regulator [Vibrio galatheae]|uniref:Response regulator n=1 Tax=Vibrio galatheae TaxID=579748 RepID=A0A0F4NNE9_9VIBR|nr:response regulator [Vibrio galatheae]KJY84378.1 response regulator [Vibrio galatheae]
MKILIVDDSKATLEIVRRGLESFGYCRLSIEKTCSATQALDIAKQWQPEIVLTDWYMPDMTGLTLTQELMKLDQGIKVGMITTVDDPNQINQAKGAGASFVLTKPFEDDELHRYLLPLVQGAEESKKALDSISEVQKELALPKLSQLEKLLQRELGSSLTLSSIPPQTFDESKIPCLLAVYEDSATQRPRAVAMLDLDAICVLSQAGASISQAEIEQVLKSQLASKGVLDACHRVLDRSALAFLDSQTRKSLRLKNISFVPSAFDKLQTLYEKEADKRVDFSCALNESLTGKVTLVGF